MECFYGVDTRGNSIYHFWLFGKYIVDKPYKLRAPES
jgi:hypothetical protein